MIYTFSPHFVLTISSRAAFEGLVGNVLVTFVDDGMDEKCLGVPTHCFFMSVIKSKARWYWDFLIQEAMSRRSTCEDSLLEVSIICDHCRSMTYIVVDYPQKLEIYCIQPDLHWLTR